MVLRPTWSVTQPKTKPPTNNPISDEDAINPCMSGEISRPREARGRANPMVARIQPSQNFPPDAHTATLVWNRLNEPTLTGSD